MKNKKCDCKQKGVDFNKIKNAHPILGKKVLRILVHYIKERYKIKLKKEGGEPKPWTEDKILQSWRFTNVRREHDTVTKWIIENVCLKDIDLKTKIYNLILCRMYNWVPTFKKIGLPILDFEDTRSIEKAEKILLKMVERKEPVFTRAYMVSGTLKLLTKEVGEMGPKLRPLKAIELWASQNRLNKSALSPPDNFYNELCKLTGINSFLAYQVFVDCTYIPEFPYSENCFVVAGPGCVNGLNLLFKDLDGLTPEEALYWLTDLLNKKVGWKEVFVDLPEEEQKMNIMSTENCLCELSKYMNINLMQGRTTRRYKGV